MAREAWVHNPERVMGYTEAAVHGCFFLGQRMLRVGSFLGCIQQWRFVSLLTCSGLGQLRSHSLFSVLQRGSRDRTTS
jgi:hypothetical protein